MLFTTKQGRGLGSPIEWRHKLICIEKVLGKIEKHCGRETVGENFGGRMGWGQRNFHQLDEYYGRRSASFQASHSRDQREYISSAILALSARAWYKTRGSGDENSNWGAQRHEIKVPKQWLRPQVFQNHSRRITLMGLSSASPLTLKPVSLWYPQVWKYQFFLV